VGIAQVVRPIFRQDPDQEGAFGAVLAGLGLVRSTLTPVCDDPLVDGGPLRLRDLHEDA
jgi:hypothetical protein